jgi:hypothetical protein
MARLALVGLTRQALLAWIAAIPVLTEKCQTGLRPRALTDQWTRTGKIVEKTPIKGGKPYVNEMLGARLLAAGRLASTLGMRMSRCLPRLATS